MFVSKGWCAAIGLAVSVFAAAYVFNYFFTPLGTIFAIIVGIGGVAFLHGEYLLARSKGEATKANEMTCEIRMARAEKHLNDILTQVECAKGYLEQSGIKEKPIPSAHHFQLYHIRDYAQQALTALKE